MKFSSLVIVVCAASAAPQDFHAALNHNVSASVYSPNVNRTLSDVYGKAKKVSQMLPWAQRARLSRNKKYHEAREAETCNFPLELMIVQDATESFQKHFEVLVNDQLPRMVEALNQSHPHSSYGLVTFRDKPVWSLGLPETDYCVRMYSPLSEDIEGVLSIYETLESYGGADRAENHFGAIHAVAQADRPGWSNSQATRLIVLLTDAPPHFAGDGYELPEYNMTAFDGIFDEANMDEQCKSTYYPSPEQVRDAIWAREAYVAFVIYDGNYWNELPSTSFQWFNSYIGQTDDFVEPLGNESTNFWTALAEIIEEIEEIECGLHSSTEEPCGPCPVPCLPCDGPCSPCHAECGCPEVEILLQHRPKHLRLDVEN